MAEIVYLNGALLPKEKARISVDDYGFLSGAGLFETMRAYNGRIFRLDKHIDRLLSSASLLGLAKKLSKAEIIEACNETLEANGLKEARIRLTVSMGEAGVFPGRIVSPTILITASRYTPPPENKYKNGFRACIAASRQYSGATLTGVKSTGYLPNLLARCQAQEHGCDEALFLNENGHITEGTTSNVFFIDAAGKLVTPPLGSGLLPGVTRRIIFELAVAPGLGVGEPAVKLEDVLGFREAFLTNSVAEVMPLVSVTEGEKEFTLGSGKPGQITRKLMTVYKELVQKETTA